MFKERTQAEQEQIIKDLLDPERVVLICGKHHYTGGPKELPQFGCKDCAMVMWKTLLAKIPPERQRETVEHIHELMAKLVEKLDKGVPFDVNISRPTINITKGH